MKNNYQMRCRQSWLAMMSLALCFALAGRVLAQSERPLVLTEPTYNCATGVFAFNSYDGDRTPIEYMAPGITSWTTNRFHVLDDCARNCADMPPFTLSARQNGKIVTYTWSRQNYCASYSSLVKVSPISDQTATVGQGIYFPIGLAFSSSVTTSWGVNAQGLPPGISYFFRQEGSGSPNPTWVLVGTPTTAGVYSVTVSASANGGQASTTFNYIITNSNNPLALITPTYNCSTGAFTFNTSGGDSTPIEFMAIGITGWTTNPNQFVDKESRIVDDVQPFTLMARQSGQVVTLNWNLKAACGRARQRIDGTDRQLTLTVLGNPVHQQLRVLLNGAQGQSVQLRLTEVGGRLLENRMVELPGLAEEQIFWLDHTGPGLLLLQASTLTQVYTVKILKQ
ncbi:Ig domain-containing protein [Spirosoma sp.]|uniref:Ig domain-containing protein n=1 Tax=Spirosoma sp. TaxID=1899569 RepID=UPI003B3B3025